MVFQFQHMDLDGSGGNRLLDDGPVPVRKLKACLADWQRGLMGRGWNSLYLSNHDQPRQVSRFGDDGEYRAASAKMLATVLHLQQGTPYVFQGEELGMANRRIRSLDEVVDVESLNAYRDLVGRGIVTPERMMAAIQRRGRDNARTPMQWDGSEQAGFTTGTPWIGVNPDYREVNAEAQRRDPDSVFHYYRKLIALRREHPVTVHGDFTEHCADSGQVFAFSRRLGGTTLLVVANLTRDPAPFDLPEEIRFRRSALYIANHPCGDVPRSGTLRPYEAQAFLLEGDEGLEESGRR
jgi:oligo-1,6-glucosidase